MSLLGEKQKQWLVEEMRKSDADFFFVVSSVNFMVPHVGPGAGGRQQGRGMDRGSARAGGVD